ncbi:MAG TPA: kynureninase [Acidimicrobiales bacterium]
MDRARAEALDRSDPLASLRDEFFIDESGPIYMDGNSLGRLSRRVADALSSGMGEWRSKVVGGWHEWVELPFAVGDQVGQLIGAAPGQVMVGDSTTVNLYKLASATLSLQSGRSVIVCDENEFPTDRYVLAGLRGTELRQIRSDPIEGVDVADLDSAVDDQTALVCLSHVNYRSAARLDIAEVTSLVHSRGAVMLWDLCHSAGAVPVDLDGGEADLAVGCTYKYLNAGPGAPAFLYVRRDLQSRLRSPISGWFAQRDQFEMGQVFEPVEGVGRFAAGSPPVLGLIAVDAAVSVLLEAGLDRLWEKSQALTERLVDLVAERLEPLGVRLGSPADPSRRGAHVSLIHPEAWPICSSLIARDLVVPDFRVPDTIRLGPAAAYTRFVDVFDAVERIEHLLGGDLERSAEGRPRVS